MEETWRESWTAESDTKFPTKKLLEVLSSRARLEEILKDEQEKTGEDETEQIGPENILMGKESRRTQLINSKFYSDKRLHDREISFHPLPENDVPLYQDAERVQQDEWVTHGSVKIIHRLRLQGFVSKFPKKDVCTQDLHVEIKKRWSVGSSW